MRRIGFATLFGLMLATPVSAATWAESMFDGLSHDFGSVTRGPTLNHSYRISNTTGMPVHIAAIRVSCGCTGATAMTSDLAPGQSTTIETHMDTRRFVGAKTVTIYVQFDRPQWDEVRLTVSANGRDDMTVTPDTLAFGHVTHGATPSKVATVTLLGTATRLVSVQSESNYVQLAARGIRNTGTELVYEVSATLRPDTPVGKWYTDIWLNTNNPESPRIRLPLSVSVQPSLTLSMPSVAFGKIKPGDHAEKRVILRGPQPFQIVGIEGADQTVTVSTVGSGAKPAHVLVVGVKPAAIGELARTLKITTDLPGEHTAQLPVTASAIMPHAD